MYPLPSLPQGAISFTLCFPRHPQQSEHLPGPWGASGGFHGRPRLTACEAFSEQAALEWNWMLWGRGVVCQVLEGPGHPGRGSARAWQGGARALGGALDLTSS